MSIALIELSVMLVHAGRDIGRTCRCIHSAEWPSDAKRAQNGRPDRTHGIALDWQR
jgi:hypothetical protein